MGGGGVLRFISHSQTPINALYKIYLSEFCVEQNLLQILNLQYFREEATSALAGFRAGLLSWSNWNLEMLVLQELLSF